MATIVIWLLGFCMLAGIESAFIKGKNVPRVGRSNEADGFYDHEMGYVIKTIPSKNIPRMGRRNYDSENRYDIPKLYGFPVDTAVEEQETTNRDNYDRYNEQQLEMLYGRQ